MISPPTTREVRRAHLRAPSDALARRGALLLEDALRTASIADGGRLLVIRALPLGRLDTRRSPAALALRIEEQVRRLGAGVVHAASPAAAHAPAVFFRDALEPYVLLALRLAREGHAREWFWPLAAAPFRPGMAPIEATRAVIAGALAAPGRIAALAALLDTLLEAGALDALLAPFTPADGPALLHACGWPAPSPTAHAPPEAPAVPPRWLPVLRHWAAQWGAAEPRAMWLAALALVAAQPARLLDPQLPEAARALAAAAAGEERQAPPEQAQQVVAHPPPAPPATTRQQHEAASSATRPATTPPAAPAPPSDALQRATQEAPASSRLPQSRAYDDAALDDREATSCGGLLFLLAPLARLGIERRLAADPRLIELGLPLAVLRACAARAGTPADDPLLLALQDPSAENGAWGEVPVTPWVAGVRRHLRRARIGLRTLVMRPALLRATRTHIDLWLPLRDADVRVRAAGLDIDPGWLPWLGRVVLFHYEDAQ